MSEKTYSEKLLNPKWQKKRLEILNRDDFKCQLCGDCDTELHVHHKEYRYGVKPWEYENSTLITYCKHCHSVVEYIKKISPLTVKGVTKQRYPDFWFIVAIVFSEKRGIVSVIITIDFKEHLEFYGALEESMVKQINNTINLYK